MMLNFYLGSNFSFQDYRLPKTILMVQVRPPLPFGGEGGSWLNFGQGCAANSFRMVPLARPIFVKMIPLARLISTKMIPLARLILICSWLDSFPSHSSWHISLNCWFEFRNFKGHLFLSLVEGVVAQWCNSLDQHCQM